jgi:uncharacterized protein
MADAVRPTDPDRRLANLDVLRAIALFGVLIVNLLTEFRVSIFNQFLGPASGSTLDRAIDRTVAIGIEIKAFVIFSLLFGVGLAIQLERARRDGRRFGVHVARRLGALLFIGLVHLVFVWNGDILTEYAVAGFLALPLLACPRPLLVAVAAASFLVFVAPLPYPAPFASEPAMHEHVAAATSIYAHGTFREVQAFRVRELGSILALDFGVLPRTFGLFALGMWAWRAELFDGSRDRTLLLRRIALVGVTVGSAATVVGTGALGELGAWQSAVDGLGAIVLGLGYAAAILFAYEQPLLRRPLDSLAPLGRMALTNYLGQSVLFGWLFYGYGLGLFGAMSVASAAFLGIAVYVAQAAASAWWLRHFRFGPIEWLWRSATYGGWQPMRHRGH